MHNFNREEISRIIEMAWEDRTPFEAIKQEFDLDQAGVKKLMQKELNSCLMASKGVLSSHAISMILDISSRLNLGI